MIIIAKENMIIIARMELEEFYGSHTFYFIISFNQDKQDSIC